MCMSISTSCYTAFLYGAHACIFFENCSTMFMCLMAFCFFSNTGILHCGWSFVVLHYYAYNVLIALYSRAVINISNTFSTFCLWLLVKMNDFEDLLTIINTKYMCYLSTSKCNTVKIYSTFTCTLYMHVSLTHFTAKMNIYNVHVHCTCTSTMFMVCIILYTCMYMCIQCTVKCVYLLIRILNHNNYISFYYMYILLCLEFHSTSFS